MFKEFFVFEFKNWLKSPFVYIFFLINFALVLAASLSPNIRIGPALNNVNINAPFALMTYATIISLFSVLMTTIFVSQAALKDFSNDFHSILFATPMKRFPYLMGRFLSSVLISCIPLLGVLLAVFVAPYFYADADKIGPQYFMAFVDTFFAFLLPNTILISAIIFALAIQFRSITVSFIGSIFLLLGYLLAGSYITDLANENVAILADPFGVNSITVITKYWTLSEKNSQWLSFGGPILMNRLLWLGVAAIIFILSYFNFSFAQKKAKKSSKEPVKSLGLESQFKVLAPLPSVNQNFDWKSKLTQFWSLLKSEFLGILKSPAFIIIVIFAAFNLMGGISASDNRYGSGNFPVTYIILEGIQGSLHLFIYVIIAYYSGALVWRERNAKFNDVIDASPFPSWMPMASKYVSMLLVTMVILAMAMTIGIGIQASKAYFNFEILLYMKQLFLIDLSQFAIVIAVSFFIHAMANKMYLGFFLFVLFLIVNKFLWGALGIGSNLIIVGGIPAFTYSDMHQYSLGLAGLIWYNFYWLLFAGLLFLGAVLFWVRGKALNFNNRLSIAKQRFTKSFAVVSSFVFILWIAIGGFLFYNANILNKFLSDEDISHREMQYEQLYKKYENIPQPRIVALDHIIDIFPNERILKVKTELVIKNKHDHAIDSIHFTTPFEYLTEIDLPGSKEVYSDEELHYFIYALNNSLEAGDSLIFHVYTTYDARGIENEISNKWINSNGSFVHSYSFMPTIGYMSKRENDNKAEREKFGLEEIVHWPKLQHTCSAACSNSYISTDSDWIRLSSTISTSSDQIAIAPGTLMKEWSEEGRNYYRYELDKPVLNFYSFLSARYEVKREVWNGVDLEVYYHKGHEFNVDKMLHSMRSSLDYFSNNFSDYPHKQARIIEFPRYASFAQAFPGTMPYSESMGFISNLEDTTEVNEVFHTVAHEMAHQWWAHQVIGAKMQGATMLSETFAHYSALMVVENEFGKEISQKLMKSEMDVYLRERGEAKIGELPLMKVESEQFYIHYQKGSIVMNAMKEYIGEDSLNAVMKRFIANTAYQEPPYTNSSVFINELVAAVPDTLQYLIDDLFKDIVLHNNNALEAVCSKLPNGQYELNLTVEIEKYRADKEGVETALDFNDYIYVGAYAKAKDGAAKGEELYYELHQLDKKNNTITILLDEEPSEAGIDPNYLLIDRRRDDNIVGVEME